MEALLLDGMKPIQDPKKLKGAKGPVWVDIDPKESDVLQEFGVTKAIFSEMSRGELPFYREFNEIICMLLLEVKLNATITKEKLQVYVTRDFILTINCRKYMEQFAKSGRTKATPEAAMGFILIGLSETNERIVEAVEKKIEGVEERLIKNRDVYVEGLLSTKRTIFAINKIFWHERDLLSFIRHSRLLNQSAESMAQLDEAHNSLLYCIDMNGNFREILTDSLDVYHTIISNKINSAIKKLTVVTVILAIIATVTSIPNTLATIFGIPYFPIKPDAKLAVLLGVDIFPWDIILVLIILGSLVPSILIYLWWNRVKLENE
jgi:Mg2+ and Co2+ transporter CorA